MYLLLGCGDLGFALANKLRENDEEVEIIERDEEKVKQLEEIGFKAHQGDFTESEDIEQAQVKKAEVILILTSDTETTESALGAIYQLKLDLDINPIIVVRAPDSIVESEIKNFGADEVIVTSEVFAEYTYGGISGTQGEDKGEAVQ